MNLMTGRFESVDDHHNGWFKMYRFRGMVEIWFGNRWINIEWS